MNIGQLDKRITIQHRHDATDAWNHGVVTYGSPQTVWASVNFRSGRETQSAEQRVNVDRVFFTIRPNSNVNVTDRVSYAGAFYDIESIETIGRGAGLRLITTMRDNDE
jgi:SPP1 family predicted phage head-tail adaptor